MNDEMINVDKKWLKGIIDRCSKEGNCFNCDLNDACKEYYLNTDKNSDFDENNNVEENNNVVKKNKNVCVDCGKKLKSVKFVAENEEGYRCYTCYDQQ